MRILRESLALQVLGYVSDSQLVEIATRALAEGLDSPSLRILAGLNDSYEAANYFQRVCVEFDVRFEDKKSVVSYLLPLWAADIVEGKIEPEQGCGMIIDQIYYRTLDWFPSDQKIAGETIGVSELLGLHWDYADLDSGLKWYADEARMVAPKECREILDRSVLKVAKDIFDRFASGALVAKTADHGSA